MKPISALLFSAFFSVAVCAPAVAWELSGRKELALVDRSGVATRLGSVDFTSNDDGVTFTLTPEPERFKDFFLSMREFKCLEGDGEILCHVPYPYPNPRTLRADDLRWLEHALLFLYKTPGEFGARLTNGVYYRLNITAAGIVGRPYAVDLNRIAAPPDDLTRPPYGDDDLTEMEPTARWYGALSIR